MLQAQYACFLHPNWGVWTGLWFTNEEVQPSRDLVSVGAPYRVLTLYDIMGHELESLVVTNPLNTQEAIRVLSLRASGIYILSIRDGEDLQVTKIRVP